MAICMASEHRPVSAEGKFEQDHQQPGLHTPLTGVPYSEAAIWRPGGIKDRTLQEWGYRPRLSSPIWGNRVFLATNWSPGLRLPRQEYEHQQGRECEHRAIVVPKIGGSKTGNPHITWKENKYTLWRIGCPKSPECKSRQIGKSLCCSASIPGLLGPKLYLC